MEALGVGKRLPQAVAKAGEVVDRRALAGRVGKFDEAESPIDEDDQVGSGARDEAIAGAAPVVGVIHRRLKLGDLGGAEVLRDIGADVELAALLAVVVRGHRQQDGVEGRFGPPPSEISMENAEVPLRNRRRRSRGGRQRRRARR